VPLFASLVAIAERNRAVRNADEASSIALLGAGGGGRKEAARLPRRWKRDNWRRVRPRRDSAPRSRAGIAPNEKLPQIMPLPLSPFRQSFRGSAFRFRITKFETTDSRSAWRNELPRRCVSMRIRLLRLDLQRCSMILAFDETRLCRSSLPGFSSEPAVESSRDCAREIDGGFAGSARLCERSRRRRS